MKNWSELTEAEQKKALESALGQIVEHIIEGFPRFNDELNKDDLQARIDKAIAKAEAMQTPWFAGEYILDDQFVREHLEGMCQCTCEDALYLEDEQVFDPGSWRVK